jgi:DNA polymerase phi
VLVPLLNLARPGGEIGNKAAGIVRQRFGKAAHSPPAAADEAHAKAILTEIHHLARHAPSAEFSTLCSSASLFAARVAPAAATEAYAATLADYVTRKASEVHAPFVAEYIKRHPARAWALAPALAGYVAPGAGVNAFRQTQAFSMLSALVTHIPQLVKSGEVSKAAAEKVLAQAAADGYATLEGVADGSLDWKADRVKEVLRFMLVVARCATSLDKERAGAICAAERITDVADKVRTGRTKDMKSLHGLLAQLAAVLGKKEAAPKAKKRKAEEAPEKEEQEEEKEQKAAKADGKAKTKTKKAPKAKKVKA